MVKSDIIFRMWDDRRNSADTKVFEALEVVGDEINSDDNGVFYLVKPENK